MIASLLTDQAIGAGGCHFFINRLATENRSRIDALMTSRRPLCPNITLNCHERVKFKTCH
jgi:hypothetical protein